jgi:DNA-directed RNA polymerase subunit RPC12/RpoP
MLLVRPKPFVNESLYGYFVRLALVNGLTEKNFFSWMSKNEERWFHYYSVNRKQLKTKLINLTNHSEINDLFDQWKYHLGNNGIFDYELTRFCPDCLCENKFYDSRWHISVNFFCERHHCYLIYKCHECLRNLNMESILNFRCLHCESSLLFHQFSKRCELYVNPDLLKIINESAKDVGVLSHNSSLKRIYFYINLVDHYWKWRWSKQDPSFKDKNHLLEQALSLVNDVYKSKQRMVDIYLSRYGIDVTFRSFFSFYFKNREYYDVNVIFIKAVEEYAKLHEEKTIGLHFLSSLYQVKYDVIRDKALELGLWLSMNAGRKYMLLGQLDILVKSLNNYASS